VTSTPHQSDRTLDRISAGDGLIFRACSEMSTSARIVQAKVRHKDGIDCGGIEPSETVAENYRSDSWLDGANLVNQLV
jgi:hypothetical protein